MTRTSREHGAAGPEVEEGMDTSGKHQNVIKNAAGTVHIDSEIQTDNGTPLRFTCYVANSEMLEGKTIYTCKFVGDVFGTLDISLKSQND